jgi:hypothetical protein
MASFGMLSVGSSGPAILVQQGEGNVLLFNSDPSNDVWLGDDPFGVVPGDGSSAAPLPPLATIVVDGSTNLYGICQPGQSAVLTKIPGGQSFFQFVEVLVKTLLVSASAGNGVFVYSAAPAVGNLIASIAAVAGVDQFGNPFQAGFTSYDPAGGIFTQVVSGQVVQGLINAVALGFRLKTSDLTGSGSWATSLISALTTGGDTPACLTLQSLGYSASGAPVVVISKTAPASPGTTALLEVQGDASAKTMASLATQTQQNFAAERVIGTYTIPAGDAINGSGYTFWGVGIAGDTGTPTLQVRVRIGGLAGAQIGNTTVITCRTAAGMAFSWSGRLAFTTAGAAAVADADCKITEHFASGAGAIHGNAAQGVAAGDSTAPITVVVTAQWSAAAVANTIQTSSGSMERINH